MKRRLMRAALPSRLGAQTHLRRASPDGGEGDEDEGDEVTESFDRDTMQLFMRTLTSRVRALLPLLKRCRQLASCPRRRERFLRGARCVRVACGANAAARGSPRAVGALGAPVFKCVRVPLGASDAA